MWKTTKNHSSLPRWVFDPKPSIQSTQQEQPERYTNIYNSYFEQVGDIANLVETMLWHNDTFMSLHERTNVIALHVTADWNQSTLPVHIAEAVP